VWEARFRLKGSKKAYEESELAYQEYRRYKQRSDLYAAAALATRDPQSQIAFSKKSQSYEAKGAAARELRKTINKADEEANNATALVGYVPLATSGKGWSFRTFEQYLNPQYHPARESALA
jgi:hypothetical protein